MRISNLHIGGFGIWSGLDIEELDSDLTVVFGPNEAGKTTLMQFIRSMLYGFSAERRERYLPPVAGGMAGGSMEIANEHGSYVLRRRAEPKGKSWREQLKIHTDDGKALEPGALSNVLAGVDEATFNNVFAVGLRELQELGTLNDTAAADHLYKLTSGMDRISLVDVVRLLRGLRTSLLCGEEGTSEITNLLKQRQDLRSQIVELSDRANRWYEVRAERNKLQQEVQRLESDIHTRQSEARTVEIATRVRDAWTRKLHRQSELGLAIGQDQDKLANMPSHAVERLDELNSAIERRQAQLRQLRSKRQALRTEASGISINRQLTNHAPRIEALAEHTQWIASLEDQIARQKKELVELDEEIQYHYESGDLPESLGTQGLTDINTKTFASLRGPARNLREQQHRLKKIEEENELGQLHAMSKNEELRSALEQRGETELKKAIENAGDLVGQLRRRVQVDERIERMENNRNEILDQIDDHVGNEEMPISSYAMVGGAFVTGLLLIATAWGFASYLGLNISTSFAMTVLGAMFMIGGMTYKSHVERNIAEQLEDSQQQLELLEQQVEQMEEERNEVDSELPEDSRPAVDRLRAAEDSLHELEELVPLDTSQRTAAEQQGVSQRRVDLALEGVERAQKRWQDALRGAGLPIDLEPQHIRRLSDAFQHVGDLRRRKQQRQEELEQRERELFVLSGRIEQLFGEVNLQPTTAEPRDQLRELSQHLASAQQAYERRHELQVRDRHLRQRFVKIRKQYDKQRRQRRLWIGQTGASGEAEFRRLAERHQHVAQLELEIATLSEQIQSTIGSHCSTEEIASRLETSSEGQLDQSWDHLSTELKGLQNRRNELHQRHGELSHEMKTLAKDRQLAETQLALGTVETKLARAVEQWQVVALTNRILEYVCDMYESERQPETLKEASVYLEQLTEGQYVRIWTPLDADLLNVDDRDGNVLRLDVLSRGTREAVFISLRLALVAALARRGSSLPLVLDDALVNFDAKRAKAAVRVFKAFAKTGHQLIIFTCHEHIMKLFRSSRVEVRTLPERSIAASSEMADWDAEPVVSAEVEEAVEEAEWEEPLEKEELEEEVLAEEEAEEEEGEWEDEEVVAEDEQEDEDEEEEWEEEPEEEYVEEELEEELEENEEELEEETVAEDAEDYELKPVEEEEEEEEEVVMEDDEEEEEEDEAYLEDEEEEQAEAQETDEGDEDLELEEEQIETQDPTNNRFTWESPERWWDTPNEAA